MDSQVLRSVVENDELKGEVSNKYLKLYVADINWIPHLVLLRERVQRKIRLPQELRRELRKIVGCAILLPAQDRHLVIDSERPQNLLFRVSSFHQYRERDWFQALQQVIKRDLEVLQWGEQVESVGVLTRVDVSPYARQAYNFLYEKAEETGAVTPSSKARIERGLISIVKRYGGVVVSNIFLRHKDALKKVLNYRSGYFFERMLYDVYTLDQIQKIKTAELVKTNSRYVKKLEKF